MKKDELINVELLNVLNETGQNLPISEGGRLNHIPLIGITTEEFYQYLDYVEQGKFGKRQIGNREFEIYKPNNLFVYDISKIGIGKGTNSQVIENIVNDKFNSLKDYKAVFKEIGNDITDKFDIKLKSTVSYKKRNTLSSSPNDVSKNQNDQKPPSNNERSFANKIFVSYNHETDFNLN
ncbi:MAG: hypothetical protein JEZ09_08760 [Salinivirgaceae bacterium]|nr:hypothetical protein [Salinivirgaceae bacterium]